MAELTVGQIVDGRYELEAVIGKGGMGCVFRAKHLITHGRVALKVLTDTVDAELQQRFLAEARAASTIGHPAIVAVTDASRTPDGQLYLVMELLAGKPLRHAMQAGLPGDQIRRIGLELLDALGAAHARGIIHRDLKPENIFVVAGTGGLKILDFGIAKVMGAGSITASGFMLGTLEYMAPEQLADAAGIDGRADLWAIGVILYEMIAGLRPLGGASREAKYHALATEEPMPIEDVASVEPDVAQFFKVALARDPAQRFQTAAQMADGLRRLSMVPQTASHVAQTGVGATLGTGAVAWDGGASQTLGTGAGVPRPPPGSIPPPNVSLAYAPTMPAPAPAATSSSGKKIALAIGGTVVAGAIAFGVVMSTRGNKVAGPPDAAIAKTPDEAPTRDAAVVVGVDAAITVASSGNCEAHCKELAKCGLRLPTCLDDCRIPTIGQCLQRAKDCEDRAACFWADRCHRPLKTGSGKCIAVHGCYATYERQAFSKTCDFCLDPMTRDAQLAWAAVQVCRESQSFEKEEASKRGQHLPTPDPDPCDLLSTECDSKH